MSPVTSLERPTVSSVLVFDGRHTDIKFKNHGTVPSVMATWVQLPERGK